MELTPDSSPPSRPLWVDLAVVGGCGAGLYAVANHYDVLVRLADWVTLHDARAVGSAVVALVGMLVTSCVLARMRRSDERRHMQTLSERETRLAGVLAQMPCIVWVTDRDLFITRVLGGALAHEDMPFRTFRGSLFDFFGDVDETFPPLAAHLRALDGTAGHYEHVLGSRPYNVRVEPLRDLSGTIVGCIGTALDASERRETEHVLERLTQRLALRHEELRGLNARLSTQLRHQSILRRVTEAVMTSLEPEHVATRFADEAGRVLGARAFRVYLTDPDGAPWKEIARGAIEPDADDDPLLTASLDAAALPGDVLRRGYAAEMDGSLLAAAALADSPADAATPLCVGGRWIGVALWSRPSDPSPPNEAQAALLHALAAPVAAALQNALRHEQLRQMFYDNAAVKLLINPASARVVDANAAAAAFYGYPPEELVGMPIQALNVLTIAEVEESMQQAGDGAVNRFVFPHRLASGEIRQVEVFASPVDVQGRRLLYSIIRDVTTEREAQQALAASENRYRSLLDHLPVGVYRSTPGGTLVEANPTMAAMLGYDDVDDLRRRDVRTLFAHDGDRERVFDRIDEAGTGLAEFALRGRDDRRVWVRDYLRAIRDDDGTILYLDGVLVDVTEQKRAESEVFELKAFYEAVLNALPLEVQVFDADLRFLYVNPAAVEDEALRSWLIGRTQGDLCRILGRSPETSRRRQAWLAHVAETGLVGRLEESFPNGDGDARHLLRIAFPVLEGGGAVSQIIAYAIDLTERKRSEVQLLHAKEQAEEMARLKSAFLANMSHEVRTPLTGIIGLASVLAEELQHEQRELADLIKQSGQRLQDTLNSVLDLARLEAGAVEVLPERLDVALEVGETVSLFRTVAREKGLTLDFRLPPAPILAILDRAYLHRIVSNLLSNAIKFTESGSVNVTVEVRGRDVRLHVSDTGLGIAQAFLPHLFDEFKQESSGLSRSHQGSGLGLAITKRLVDHMGGRIEVESAKGSGSRFTVTLPGSLHALAAAGDLAEETDDDLAEETDDDLAEETDDDLAEEAAETVDASREERSAAADAA